MGVLSTEVLSNSKRIYKRILVPSYSKNKTLPTILVRLEHEAISSSEAIELVVFCPS